MKNTSLVRTFAVTALSLAAMASAHADLTIPFATTSSNSVQKFPAEVLQAFDLLFVEIAAKGNTTSLGDVPATDPPLTTQNAQSYSFPVTSIVIGSKLNIAAGSAVGSALQIQRPNDTDGAYIGFTLSNFTIDYVNKKVIADVKPYGAASVRSPIYTFNVATPLALKYKFPLTVTGHEVLDKLTLTAESKAVFTSALQLPDFALFALDYDYGTLTQDISTNARKPKLASTKPYVPAN